MINKKQNLSLGTRTNLWRSKCKSLTEARTREDLNTSLFQGFANLGYKLLVKRKKESSSNNLVEDICVKEAFVDEQGLHGIAGSRVISLGVHHNLDGLKKTMEDCL